MIGPEESPPSGACSAKLTQNPDLTSQSTTLQSGAGRRRLPETRFPRAQLRKLG